MKPLVFALAMLVNSAAFAAAPSTAPAVFDVRAYGAVGDGEANATKAIQSAIDAAAGGGGGTVLVPAGRYVTGSLVLRSNINLHVDAGAVLLGSENKDDFPLWVSKWEGDGVKPRHAALFTGEELENVSLTGRGVIDVRGKVWWTGRVSGVVKEDLRPFTFRLVNSKNVLIDGLTFRNSPMWTLTPLACENVNIHHVTIQNPADSPNTDGINPESCKNVHISDCLIDVGDDCVTLKCGTEDDGRREHRPTENVTITNCTMMHGHGGVVFGSEMSGSIRNVAIANCVFVGTDRGLRFKSRRGRGGAVEDVRANNIVMDGVLVPIAVNLFYAPGARGEKKITDTNPWPVDDTTPRFRRLRFTNISARNIKSAATFILGLPEMPVDDVVVSDCSFFVDPTATTPTAPEMFPDSKKIARAGILATGVTHLTIRNTDISDQSGPALTVTNGKGIAISELAVRTAPAGSPLILLNNVAESSIRNTIAPAGTTTAVQVKGKESTHLRLDDNDWSAAAKAVERSE